VKVLVTGGCGFIGSHFVRHLLRDRDDVEEVRNLDLLTYAGGRENLADLETDRRYAFLQGDIRDAEAVARMAEGVDWIVNFAAETHVDRSIREAGGFVLTDVHGTYMLLEACRRGEARLLQVSTDEVYGTAPPGESFDETAPLSPRNPYAASKSGGDLLARSYHITYGLPVIVTRCTNNIGPNQHVEKMVPLFTTNALLGLPLPLYGDGRQVRDWIWVGDHVRALALLMDRGEAGKAYNISAAQERMNIDVARGILDLLGLPEDRIRAVGDRPGHDRRYSLRTPLLEELGWRPEVGFEEALERTVGWYRDNEPWWRTRREDEGFRRLYRHLYRDLEGGEPA